MITTYKDYSTFVCACRHGYTTWSHMNKAKLKIKIRANNTRPGVSLEVSYVCEYILVQALQGVHSGSLRSIDAGCLPLISQSFLPEVATQKKNNNQSTFQSFRRSDSYVSYTRTKEYYIHANILYEKKVTLGFIFASVKFSNPYKLIFSSR